MYRIVYNRCCFYWAIIDDKGAEIDWATTKEWAERILADLLKK